MKAQAGGGVVTSGGARGVGTCCSAKARRGGASKRPQRVSRPRQNGERERFGNLQPVVPVVQVGEAVGAHDPHEMRALQHRRHAAAFSAVAGTGLLLDIGHDEARMRAILR